MDFSPLHSRRTLSSSGFTLLFAMLVGSLLLAIGLSIFSLVFRELGLATLTRDSSAALYAADAGAECALYWEFQGEKPNGSMMFDPADGSPVDISCSGNAIQITNITQTLASTTWAFNFSVGEVSAGGESCAVVKVEKNKTTYRTIIQSSGRNEGGEMANCAPGNRTVERTLEYRF